MKKILSMTFFAVVVLFLSILLVRGRMATPSDVTSTPDTSIPDIDVVEQFIPSVPDTSVLKAGGSSYTDPGGLYSLLYPNDYVLDTADPQHIRLYMRGATQRGQTEIYDGVLLVLENIDLQGKPLGEWVDARIQESTADGTSEVIQPKKIIQLFNYPGYTYEVRGLGTSTTLIVQKDLESSDALSITMMVADPNQVGYQKDLEATLSTLELLR